MILSNSLSLAVSHWIITISSDISGRVFHHLIPRTSTDRSNSRNYQLLFMAFGLFPKKKKFPETHFTSNPFSLAIREKRIQWSNSANNWWLTSNHQNSSSERTSKARTHEKILIRTLISQMWSCGRDQRVSGTIHQQPQNHQTVIIISRVFFPHTPNHSSKSEEIFPTPTTTSAPENGWKIHL